MGAENSRERNSSNTSEREHPFYAREDYDRRGANTYHTNHLSPPQAPTYHMTRQQSQMQVNTYQTIDQSTPQAPTYQTIHQSTLQAPKNHSIQESPAQVPIERDRKPYSYTSADLQNAVKQSNPQPTLEWSRQPYNLSTNELQKQANPQSSLYPNLNQIEENFVHVNLRAFVNHEQRTPVQPSAPPASQVLKNETTSRAAQPFASSSNAPGPSKTAKSPANKNRPRPANNDHRNQDKLNCPTCGQRLGLTIFQCSNGHSCCKGCRLANKSCGNCQSPITEIRNIMLEAYIAELKTACQNQGCTLKFSVDEMEKHMKECPFGETDCPMGTYFGQCTARCKVPDLAAHFDNFHKEQRIAEIDKEMFVFNVCIDAHNIYLVKNGPFSFLVHVKVGENERKISFAVQLFGSKMSAAKWTYEIHVYNKRQPLRKYLYADTCQPISTSVEDIIKDSRCATLPLPFAMTFVNESALTYKFYIKKQVNSRGKWSGPKNNTPNVN